ncbi:MAG: type IV pilin N-terminal domain-containing protein [Methanoregula sp.]|nr:type IV pilin N-terminal domain-containing protein [Methanoregula sp.]
MEYLNRRNGKNDEEAISPVIGVMLMLAVTIIIAAVVSAFSGGAFSGTQKAPSATVDIHIRNGTNADTSSFTIKVLGVSEPIPTKNLKVVTSWTSGTLTGGSATYAGLASANTVDGSASTAFSVPTGYGEGVDEWDGAQWGDFTWLAGTTCSDSPSSDYGESTPYVYGSGSHDGTDPMQAILGNEWYNLKQGDIVTVRIIHVPSGNVIVSQQVVVEG